MKALQRAHDKQRRIDPSDFPTFGGGPDDDDEEEEESEEYVSDQEMEESSSDGNAGASSRGSNSRSKKRGAASSSSSAGGSALGLGPVGQAGGKKLKRMKIPAAERRCLVFASRGIPHRLRHLLKDIRTLLPHHKKDVKFDGRKDQLYEINQICEMKSCASCIFLESRKSKDFFLWMSKTPHGPRCVCCCCCCVLLLLLRSNGEAEKRCCCCCCCSGEAEALLLSMAATTPKTFFSCHMMTGLPTNFYSFF